MTKRQRTRAAHEPSARWFVQVATGPSIGVEVSSGQAWVGVDRQVGHGSADALFPLTSQLYEEALADGYLGSGYVGECWRGEHDAQSLFDPARGGGRPERWVRQRPRVVSPSFLGEIWHHVDALGEAPDAEPARISSALAAGTAGVTVGPAGVRTLTFALVGEGAYPRPFALIGGLDAGSDRARVRSVLGEPVADPDVHAIEGDLLRLGYVEGGLAEVVLESPVPGLPPAGSIRTFLSVVGEPERGGAFMAILELVGEAGHRWAASSGFGRRLLDLDGGVELQIEQTRVLSARVRLRARSGGGVYRGLADLVDGVAWPATREDLRRVLGDPVASDRVVDLYRYGRRDLWFEYDADGQPLAMTACLTGISVSPRLHRWRSGEFTLFVDVLGRRSEEPLVDHVRGLRGVQLRFRGDAVTEVEIGRGGHRAERLKAFVDGMPDEPTRTDLRFGTPDYHGDRDDLYDADTGWVRVHASDGRQVTSITVSQDPPRGLGLRRRMHGAPWP